jgi:hypothetical protein
MISDRDRHGVLALRRRIAALAASTKCDLALERYRSWLREMEAHLAATAEMSSAEALLGDRPALRPGSDVWARGA